MYEGEIIVINGLKYTLAVKDETQVLLRFNEKYKMWIELQFSTQTAQNSFVDVLSRQYIDSKV